MTYWLLAAVVTLCAFTVALLASALVMRLAGAWVATRAATMAPAARAAAYFRLRVVPVAASAAFAGLLVLPTFLAYEPRQTDERLALTLAFGSIIGLALLTTSAVRAARAWRATRALERAWRAGARPLDGLAAPLPAFAVDDAFPTVAVVGCARPVLFVSERVLRECGTADVQAMIAHECAHIRAADNFKRLLLRACPALPFAREIDRAWAAAAEEAADDRAAGGDPARRLDLAQALVRVARLAPPPLDAPVSAFYAGGSIESRIRLLLDPVVTPAVRPRRGVLIACVGILAFGSAFLALGPAVHQGMEALVRLLP